MKKMKNGSVLVYSLIILSMMLAITVVMSSVSLLQRKSATSTGSSAQSLQTADSGSQLAVKALSKNPGGKLSDIFASCSNAGGTAKVTGNISGMGDYSIVFYKDETTLMTNCNDLASDVFKIKSTGESKGTVRAIEVAMASAGSGPGSWTCHIVSGAGFASCSSGEVVISGGCGSTAGGYPSDGGSGVFSWSGCGSNNAYALCCK